MERINSLRNKKKNEKKRKSINGTNSAPTISFYILSILLIKKLTKPPFRDKTCDKKANFRFFLCDCFFLFMKSHVDKIIIKNNQPGF